MEGPAAPTPLQPTEPLALLFRDLRSGRRGLSEREAARRLAVYGPNELVRSKRRSPWLDLLDQVVHPLALLLWVAAVLSWIVGAPVLSVAIVGVIVLNATFAFVQERQGEKAVEALARYLPQHAAVRRDGVRREVPARDLVPGDVIELTEGDRVCADARLVEGSLEVDMSALTGESLPAFRSAAAHDSGAALLQAQGLVFSGTSCTGGDAVAVVVTTGMRTELGRIATLTQAVPRERSPLEVQVRRVAVLIAIVAVVAAVAFIPVGVLVAGLPWADSLSFAIGLIVANVPEGLLPTITLALAVSVRELARRGALVKRLSAVETLGATSVIGTDKTGTLTQNRMHGVLLWTPTSETPLVDADVVAAGADVVRTAEVLSSCNTASSAPGPTAEGLPPAGDPTELALLAVAAQLGADVDERRRGADRLALHHFDPERRLMSTVDSTARGPVVHTKGAPESVLARSGRVLRADGSVEVLDAAERDRWSDAVQRYARRGLRLIAAAYRDLDPDPLPTDRDDVERDLTVTGIVALLDPPRPEVADAVARCRTAGVRVVVITGDHPLTAGEIARQVGVGGGRAPDPLVGADLERLTDSDLDAALAGDYDLVIARASAELKMRVTESLQASGHVVAVTGDGVNDAPALRRADIGVAMGRSGTDVAREAATMVITDDNFRTVAEAVEGGRRVYDDVRKFVLYIFAHATPEIVPFLVFALSGGRVPLPLTVLQILAIDIGTETLPALALGREPAEPGIMRRPPRPPSEPLIQRRLLVRAWGLLGGVSAVLVLAGFFLVLGLGGWTPGADVSAGSPLHATYLQATTMTFLGIVACQVGTAFGARTDRVSLLSVGLLTNRWLLWGIAFELVFAAAVVLLPGVGEALGMALPPVEALLLLPVFPLVVLTADELVKWLGRARSQPTSASSSAGSGVEAKRTIPSEHP